MVYIQLNLWLKLNNNNYKYSFSNINNFNKVSVSWYNKYLYIYYNDPYKIK